MKFTWFASLYVHLHTTAFRLFFRYFNDFRVRKASIREAGLLDRYLLLCLFPKNTTLHFSEPKLRRSNCYESLFTLPKPRFSSKSGGTGSVNRALWQNELFNLGSKKCRAVICGQKRSKRYQLGRCASTTEFA